MFSGSPQPQRHGEFTFGSSSKCKKWPITFKVGPKKIADRKKNGKKHLAPPHFNGLVYKNGETGVIHPYKQKVITLLTTLFFGGGETPPFLGPFPPTEKKSKPSDSQSAVSPDLGNPTSLGLTIDLVALKVPMVSPTTVRKGITNWFFV